MNIVQPITINESRLIDCNIIEDTPRSTSATTYNAWDSTATYSASDVVCLEYDNDEAGVYPEQGAGLWFGVFSSDFSANTNRDPAIRYGTGAGYDWWTQTAYAPKWQSTISYAVGTIVGHIHGSTGAFYECIQAGAGQDPATASSYWKQTTTDSYNEWSGATTYADGDRVVVLNGTMAAVYESLQGSNLNQAPATETAYWQFLGDTYKQWASGTTYAAGDIVIDLRTHHRYESLQGSNTGKDPTTGENPTWWLDLGANKRWAMFDLSNSSVSSFAEEIDFTIAPGSACDTIALLNMTANQVQIIVNSTTGGGEVYNETFDLTDSGQITDWRKYFFQPLSYKADLLVSDLPLYSDMTVRAIASYSGGTVQVGAVVVGLTEDLGASVYGATSGIIDYSRKEADDFGNYTFVQRAFSKTGQFRVIVAKASHDSVFSRMAELRASPTLFIGTGDYASAWIFGFYRGFEAVIEYPQESVFNFEIEGLT